MPAQRPMQGPAHALDACVRPRVAGVGEIDQDPGHGTGDGFSDKTTVGSKTMKPSRRAEGREFSRTGGASVVRSNARYPPVTTRGGRLTVVRLVPIGPLQISRPSNSARMMRGVIPRNFRVNRTSTLAGRGHV